MSGKLWPHAALFGKSDGTAALRQAFAASFIADGLTAGVLAMLPAILAEAESRLAEGIDERFKGAPLADRVRRLRRAWRRFERYQHRRVERIAAPYLGGPEASAEDDRRRLHKHARAIIEAVIELSLSLEEDRAAAFLLADDAERLLVPIVGRERSIAPRVPPLPKKPKRRR